MFQTLLRVVLWVVCFFPSRHFSSKNSKLLQSQKCAYEGKFAILNNLSTECGCGWAICYLLALWWTVQGVHVPRFSLVDCSDRLKLPRDPIQHISSSKNGCLDNERKLWPAWHSMTQSHLIHPLHKGDLFVNQNKLLFFHVREKIRPRPQWTDIKV